MRISCKSTFALCGIAISLFIPLVSGAQAANDPEAALKSINSWYSDQIKQARDNKTTLDTTKLLAERRAKIQAALKDADVEKTEPSKCLALAQLYSSVQMQKESLAAAKRFLTSNPVEAQKYSAQQMILNGYQASGDVSGILEMLDTMKPYNPTMAANLLSLTARSYAGIVADKKGLQAGLDLIAKQEKLVDIDKMMTEEATKRLGESTVASLALGKSSLYEKAGKATESEAILQDAIKKLGPDNNFARSMVSKLKLAHLVGNPAPELAVERHYGDYSSLSSLRGKVVVLDFTADWCVFCKKAYPDMKKMYAELHSKGLEVIGVTTYYGYYKDQKNLSPEAEYVANKGHIEEFGLPWPLLFGPRDNFTNFGVSGIPHYVVIGRDGKVASVTVGYNEPLHKQLRTSVEKALEVSASK